MNDAQNSKTKKLRYNDGWPWWMKHTGHLRRTFITATSGGAIILMYHRVAELADDPHDLAISPSEFKKHIETFSGAFHMVSLQEIIQRLIENRPLPKKSLCLTFDDGYADNFTCALPILERYGAPATFFIAGTGLVDPSHHYTWETQEAESHEHATPEMLARASSSSLVEIGGHTQTHPHLAQLSPEDQYQEIRENSDLLAEITGRAPAFFAYPFGGPADFNEESVNAVRRCGYTAAVTTSSGFVCKGADRYRLPREDVSRLSATDAQAFLDYAFGG